VADVGGFGVGSDTSWEAIATLNYRLRDWLWLRAGYRHLEVDYEDGGFVHDVQMSGPMMGAGLQFQARRRRLFRVSPEASGAPHPKSPARAALLAMTLGAALNARRACA
jgi:hypothetical protein